MARTFRVEMTATRVFDVTLEDNDLGPTDTSLEDVAEELARDNAFFDMDDKRVQEIECWDLTIEAVTERKTETV